MRQRLPIKRSNPATKQGTLVSTLLTYIPGVWIVPKESELISLYRLRYKMAMDEQKYDSAMIFLNKILELDPLNLEAKFCKAEMYHRCLNDYTRAIDQYNRLIRLTANQQEDRIHVRARAAMSELMEMLS